MSRAYWVKVASSVSVTVRAEDRVSNTVDLDPILDKGEMLEVLVGALEGSGWKKQEGGYVKDLGDGQTSTWDVEQGKVTTVAGVDEVRVIESEVTVTLDTDYNADAIEQRKQSALAAHEADVRARARQDETSARQKAAQILESGESSRTRHLNEVLQKTYVEAVKRKASRLGAITSIHEGAQGGEYSLTIVIAE